MILLTESLPAVKLWTDIKHAFAVDTPLPPPTAEDLALIDRLCGQIVSRGLTPAAALFIEMSRPLHYVGGQLLHFLQPIASALFSAQEIERLANFLERRDAVDIISSRLDACVSGKSDHDELACDNDSAASAENRTSTP